MKYIVTIILSGLSAYGGSYIALQHFENTHSMILIQQSDAKILARDTDAERSERDWERKKVGHKGGRESKLREAFN